MPLTEVAIRKAKPREKAYKLADERGLFLLVKPNDSKYWRLKYRFNGKEKLLALGVYPDTNLANAREKRDEARKLLANNVDPGIAKQVSKRAAQSATKDSFEAIGREWFAKFSGSWVEEHSDKIIRRLERDIFPWLGKRPISEIEVPEILSVLQRILDRGALDTAHRAKQNCGQIFRYAIATARAKHDPTRDLQGALPPLKENHHPTITDPKKIGGLLRAIDGYEGFFVTKCALQLAPRLFVRPGELRKAEWPEFNYDEAEWRIPDKKMKMRIMHIVPLSSQVIKILRDLQALTGNGKYVFPSIRTPSRPMSDNTVNGALRRLGYTGDEITGHGFRSMASTILNEQGWNSDAIERQLAHIEQNNVRAAYNYAQYLPERRKMMQYWSDYLDSLANGITKPQLEIA